MGAGPASRRNDRVLGVRHALSILLLALAGGLVLAACGNGEEELSREEYERELDGTRQQIGSAFEDVSQELRGVGGGSASLDGAAEELEETRGRLEQAADDLDDVQPPGDAEDAHDELVDGIRELSAEFGDFAEAVESGNVSRIQQFASDFRDLDSVQKIDAAIKELEEQGYRADDSGR